MFYRKWDTCFLVNKGKNTLKPQQDVFFSGRHVLFERGVKANNKF